GHESDAVVIAVPDRDLSQPLTKQCCLSARACCVEIEAEGACDGGEHHQRQERCRQPRQQRWRGAHVPRPGRRPARLPAGCQAPCPPPLGVQRNGQQHSSPDDGHARRYRGCASQPVGGPDTEPGANRHGKGPGHERAPLLLMAGRLVSRSVRGRNGGRGAAHNVTSGFSLSSVRGPIPGTRNSSSMLSYGRCATIRAAMTGPIPGRESRPAGSAVLIETLSERPSPAARPGTNSDSPSVSGSARDSSAVAADGKRPPAASMRSEALAPNSNA